VTAGGGGGGWSEAVTVDGPDVALARSIATSGTTAVTEGGVGLDGAGGAGRFCFARSSLTLIEIFRFSPAVAMAAALFEETETSLDGGTNRTWLTIFCPSGEAANRRKSVTVGLRGAAAV
jgi:hypothetical protein